MIVIIDYGVGNLGSILNMLKRIDVDASISSSVQDIEKADKLILPGVGSFDNAMKNIVDLGLLSVINEKVINTKTPILGICLGMQLFTNRSEEGISPGLGWIDGETVKFRFDNKEKYLRIPHMGWNTVTTNERNGLFADLDNNSRFYFVHSYHVTCDEKEILSKTHYGYDFVSSVKKDHILGVQFHPEKSHKYGMQILKNFAGVRGLD